MKPTTTLQKLRGGYYTPQPISDFLARWSVQTDTAKILEPSCGDGVILEAAAKVLGERGATDEARASLLHAVELDHVEAQKAAARLSSLPGLAGFQVYNGDFFAYCKRQRDQNQLFDVVIGNPPFIRYQNFPEEHRAIAFYLMQTARLHPNRLTNAWVPFLVASSLLLNENGRLAMVIPAELLQVNYAAELRYFLSRYFKRLTLITFKKLVFGDIQQEVVLLLGERSSATHSGIRVVELNGLDDLARFVDSTPVGPLKEMDHSTEKWTRYFLEEAELCLLRAVAQHPELTIARDVIDVDVGIVTGLNEFFVLPEHLVQQHSLEQFTVPIVSRSAHLSGLVFSKDDWSDNVEKKYPAFLLKSPDSPLYTLPEALKSYITQGEEQNLNKGYKCRIRNRWYVVPSVWNPDAFMLRQIHNYPKIVVNEATATSTDTIHRVRMRNGVPVRTVAAAFLNSLTFAFAEVSGRSYGGGILELEPNEAETLPLPLKMAESFDTERLDCLLRQNKIDAVLDLTDDTLLRQGLGLDSHDVKRLRAIWQKLRDRRINRKPFLPSASPFTDIPVEKVAGVSR